jgi:hypothetical protein
LERQNCFPGELRERFATGVNMALLTEGPTTEAAVQGDGTFSLSNLTPGLYWLVARQASEEDASERFPGPLAWNLNSRASLRRDGEASNTVVDLKPCQRVSDYKLPYVPPVETTNEPPRTRHP